ncbi:MAG TPA: FAD-binding oxidoreductase [Solirubrobacterales bacterium]|jgi:4-cresol dehydrogenase (hydroxylating)
MAQSTQVTPDAVAQAAAGALDEFRSVLGADAVLTSEDALREFRDPFAPSSWDEYTASAVLMPETVDQVQEIVRIAGDRGVPLWPQGQGRNNGYGGAGPRLKGSVTVNLRRMNKIIEIDDDLAYAVVEPGVSFIELYEAIRDGGHPLMLSVPDLGWGSVVGNALDNGLTYLPNGRDQMAPCGMEVVTADGGLMRTNMGAMEGNPSWNLYRRSLGPALDGLFTQSNFGIVTKMGVWLMPEPEMIELVTVTVPAEEQIVELIDTLRPFLLSRDIEGVPCIFNTVNIACATSQRDDWYDGTDPMPDAVIDEVGQKLGVGRWLLRFALYGDGAILDHRFRKIEAAFAAIPGAVIDARKVTPRDAPALPDASDRALSGVPSLDWAKMAGWYGGDNGGHMPFSPVVPLKGREFFELHRRLRSEVESFGLDYGNDLIVVNARSACSVVSQFFDFSDESQTRKAYEMNHHLVRAAAKLGYGEYRAHLDFMDTAAEQYGFSDHAYMRFVEKIKDAVDPRGILAPGKQGIWPAAMRDRKS